MLGEQFDTPDEQHSSNEAPSEINLKARTIALIGAVMVVTLSITVILSLISTHNERTQFLHTRVNLVSLIQSEALGGPMWNLDLAQISEHLQAIARDPDFKGAAVYHNTGVLVDKYGSIEEDEDTLFITQNIYYNNLGKKQDIGRLELFVSTKSLSELKVQQQIFSIIAFFLLLLTTLSSIYFVLRKELGKLALWYNKKTIELSNTLKKLRLSNEQVELSNKKLQRESSLTRFLNEITVAVNNADTTDNVLRLCLDTISDFTNWPLGHVYNINPETKRIEPTDIWYYENAELYQNFIKNINNTSLNKGEGIVGKVFLDGYCVWIKSIDKEGDFLLKHELQSAYLKSAFAFPVYIGSDIVAILEFFSNVETPRDEELIKTIMSACIQLGRTIERRQAEENLKIAKKNAEQANKSKSEFLANMSHELRTPLNSLLILASMFVKNRQGNLTEQQIEAANIIHSSGNDLLTLINDILDLAKVEAGKMTVDLLPFNLSEIVDHIQRSFTPVAEKKALGLELSLDPELPKDMISDKVKIEQILRNFISNALKFTSEGKISVKIKRPSPGIIFKNINLEHSSTIEFSVSDTGIGIPADKKELIFSAFEQADGSTSRKYGGTGLGLSICLKMSALLNGEVQMDSVVDQGSTFSLYLPQKPLENLPSPNEAENSE